MVIPGVSRWGFLPKPLLPVKVFTLYKVFLEEWRSVHGKVPSLAIVAKGMELLRGHFSHGVQNTPGNVENVNHDGSHDAKNGQFCKIAKPLHFRADPVLHSPYSTFCSGCPGWAFAGIRNCKRRFVLMVVVVTFANFENLPSQG
jgi:hypothetical protein